MVKRTFGGFTFLSGVDAAAEESRLVKERRVIAEALGPGGASVPRVAKMLRRRLGPTDNLISLIEAGWGRDDVARLIDSWPTVGTLWLSGAVLDVAADVVRAGISDPADVSLWTHVMFVPSGQHTSPSNVMYLVGARGAEYDERGLQHWGPLVALYLAATGDARSALVAAAAGLTPEETEGLDVTDEQRMGELRARAAARGITVP